MLQIPLESKEVDFCLVTFKEVAANKSIIESELAAMIGLSLI